jgi:hypothetical protein
MATPMKANLGKKIVLTLPVPIVISDVLKNPRVIFASGHLIVQESSIALDLGIPCEVDSIDAWQAVMTYPGARAFTEIDDHVANACREEIERYQKDTRKFPRPSPCSAKLKEQMRAGGLLRVRFPKLDPEQIIKVMRRYHRLKARQAAREEADLIAMGFGDPIEGEI